MESKSIWSWCGLFIQYAFIIVIWMALVILISSLVNYIVFYGHNWRMSSLISASLMGIVSLIAACKK